MSLDRAALTRLRHDLRTPLNHILGYSELLLEDLEAGAPCGLAPPLRKLHGQARSILALINEHLGPARVEARVVDLDGLCRMLRPPVEGLVASCASLRSDAAGAETDELLADVGRIASAVGELQALVAGGMGERSVPWSVVPAIVVVAPPGATAPAGPRVIAAPAAAASTGDARPVADIAPPSIERGLVLVVDDDAENRDVLARRLARQGYEVRVTVGGAEALELLRREPIDLVLLDVMMPELPGDEVLRRIKADPVLRDLPVLMISALDEVESVVRCIELGADDYLPKPFDPVLLGARIRACLEKKRLRDQERRHLHELAEWNRTLEQRVREKVAEVERLGRLKRFFSPQLAELIVAGGADDPLRTHRREITVVFLDLRGFTAFAEAAEPEEVMGVLREYHAAMGELILAHEGTLERFAGDGMMVFFNDPQPVPNPAERAVRMAVAMRERVARLAAAWRKRGHDLALGVGIAQGYATLGAIGFEGRWDYGAIGTVTNLAARLCDKAQAGQILLSSRVAAAVEEAVELEEVGSLSLKGLLRPVPTFNVL